MVCARFIRRAQAGGELLADDVAADVEADAAASVPAELPSPVAARLPPPSKLLLRLPAARRSGLITASAPFARLLVADTGCTAGAISRSGAAGERRTAARSSGYHSASRGKSARRHADAS